MQKFGSRSLFPTATMFTFRAVVIARKSVSFRSLATAAASSSSSKAFNIPIIDFSKFQRAQSDAEKRKTADEIVNAFKTSGFIYLSNHGIPRGKAIAFIIQVDGRS